MKIVLALIVLLVVGCPAALFFLSSAPLLVVHSPPTVVGVETPIRLRIDSPHGVRRLTAAIEQNGVRYPVFERSQPASR